MEEPPVFRKVLLCKPSVHKPLALTLGEVLHPLGRVLRHGAALHGQVVEGVGAGLGFSFDKRSSLSRQTLEGSFSAVSKPKFASKYAFESSRRDLHNALLCTALKSHFFEKRVEFS